jgi:hypothetical protein
VAVAELLTAAVAAVVAVVAEELPLLTAEAVASQQAKEMPEGMQLFRKIVFIREAEAEAPEHREEMQ